MVSDDDVFFILFIRRRKTLEIDLYLKLEFTLLGAVIYNFRFTLTHTTISQCTAF